MYWYFIHMLFVSLGLLGGYHSNAPADNIRFLHVSTKDMLADMLTKPLPRVMLERHTTMFGIAYFFFFFFERCYFFFLSLTLHFIPLSHWIVLAILVSPGLPIVKRDCIG